MTGGAGPQTGAGHRTDDPQRRQAAARTPGGGRASLVLPLLLMAPSLTCCGAVLAVITAWPLVKIVALSMQLQPAGKFALFHSGRRRSSGSPTTARCCPTPPSGRWCCAPWSSP